MLHKQQRISWMFTHGDFSFWCTMMFIIHDHLCLLSRSNAASSHFEPPYMVSIIFMDTSVRLELKGKLIWQLWEQICWFLISIFDAPCLRPCNTFCLTRSFDILTFFVWCFIDIVDAGVIIGVNIASFSLNIGLARRMPSVCDGGGSVFFLLLWLLTWSIIHNQLTQQERAVSNVLLLSFVWIAFDVVIIWQSIAWIHFADNCFHELILPLLGQDAPVTNATFLTA